MSLASIELRIVTTPACVASNSSNNNTPPFSNACLRGVVIYSPVAEINPIKSDFVVCRPTLIG